MNDNKIEASKVDVPYIVYESAMARAERQMKKLWIALIIAIIAIVATNSVWIWYISQYDFVDSEVNVDTEGEGNANYIGQDGDIYNGTNNSQNTEKG